MVAGYAAFSTNLEIKGTSKVTSNWDIEITNVTEGIASGSAENTVKPSWGKLWASMEADLYDVGDSMEYDVTIENKGNIDAKLNDILTNVEKENNEAVIITFSGYTKGEILKAGASKQVHVKIEYNPEYEGGETSSEVEINFDYVQNNNEKNPSDNQYLVTYDYQTNGGTSADIKEEYYGSGNEVNLDNKAYKEGWTFVGWNTDKDAEVGLESLQVKENTTLYAIYSKTLKVTYEKGENIESIGKVEDSCNIYNNQTSCEITLPEINVIENYTVDGWYKENSKVGLPNEKYSIKDNITLISKAKQNMYTVTYDYDTNGGTSASKTSDLVQDDADVDLTPTATKDGWTFVGWNTDKTATSGLTSLRVSSDNIVLYAIFSKEITLNFNSNGATISDNSKTCTMYNNDESCEIITPSITRSGFEILGWGTSSNSQTAVANSAGKIEADSNNTYYAVTKKVITVTFNKGSHVSSVGSASEQCTILNSATNCQVTFPTITASSGYTSVGWSTTNGASSGTSAGSKLTVSSNATYYANAVDKTGPTCSLSVKSATVDNVVVEATCTDVSGVSKYEYKINSGSYVNNGTTKTYTFTSFDLSTIRLKATDGVGNVTEISMTQDALNKGYDIIYSALNTKYQNLLSTENSYKNSFLNKTYPVGSIYISTSSTNPSSLFGGTWSSYGAGRTLVGVGSNGESNYTSAGLTGGKEKVSVAVANLPSHTHSFTPSGTVTSTFKGNTGTLNTTGGHTHTIPYVSTATSNEGGYGNSTAAMYNSGYFVDRLFVSGNTTTSTSSAGTHTHSYTPSGTVSSSFTGTKVNTNSSGSSSSVDVRNPYIVTYMWRRTA